MRGEMVHYKSSDPAKALCGQDVGSDSITTERRRVTCHACNYALKHKPRRSREA